MMEANVTGDGVYCAICPRRLAGRERVLRGGVLIEIICFDRVHWFWSKAASRWTHGKRREVAGIHRRRPKPDNAPPRPGKLIWHDERAWWHVAPPAEITCPDCGTEQVAESLAR